MHSVAFLVSWQANGKVLRLLCSVGWSFLGWRGSYLGYRQHGFHVVFVFLSFFLFVSVEFVLAVYSVHSCNTSLILRRRTHFLGGLNWRWRSHSFFNQVLHCAFWPHVVDQNIPFILLVFKLQIYLSSYVPV